MNYSITDPKPLPSQELLLRLLRYDQNSGKLYYKITGKEAFSSSKKGYHRGSILGVEYPSRSRIIWKMVTGVDPVYIDHIDGNRSNDRFSNLRSVDSQTNNRNRSISNKNTSGVVGVHWHIRHKSWVARITVNRVKIHLGMFSNIDDATNARKSGEIKYGFHKNHGRAKI